MIKGLPQSGEGSNDFKAHFSRETILLDYWMCEYFCLACHNKRYNRASKSKYINCGSNQGRVKRLNLGTGLLVAEPEPLSEVAACRRLVHSTQKQTDITNLHRGMTEDLPSTCSA